jgi:trk system potassium uptake protein
VPCTTAPRSLLANDQIRFFLGMVALVVLISSLVLTAQSDYDLGRAATLVAFNLVSIISTTGYASTDYTLWGPFFVAAFSVSDVHRRLLRDRRPDRSRPSACRSRCSCWETRSASWCIPTGLRRQAQPENGSHADITNALVAFIFAVGVTVIAVTMALAAMGLDLLTALSSAGTAITNVGPGRRRHRRPGGQLLDAAGSGQVAVGGRHAARPAGADDRRGAAVPSLLASVAPISPAARRRTPADRC